VCAADESGRAVVDHVPMAGPELIFLLEAFRSRVGKLLHESHTVLTGLNHPSPEANDVTAMTIEMYLKQVTTVTHMRAVPAVREGRNFDHLHGLIFIPRQLAQDDINSLLLLPLNKDRNAFCVTDDIAGIVPGERKKK
jgi:hypothetical protein